MAPDISYKIITLPKSCADANAWTKLVQKQKDFRLYSLRTSPDAFASTTAREEAFGWETWKQRLTSPIAHTLIAVSVPAKDADGVEAGLKPDEDPGLQEVLRNDWIGQIVLMGPLPESMSKSLTAKEAPSKQAVWALSQSDSAPAKQNREAHFHLNAVFVPPSHRGRGIAQALISAALVRGKRVAGVGTAAVRRVRYTIMVDEPNVPALRLYQKESFVQYGEEMVMMTRREKDRVEIPDHESRVLLMEATSELS